MRVETRRKSPSSSFATISGPRNPVETAGSLALVRVDVDVCGLTLVCSQPVARSDPRGSGSDSVEVELFMSRLSVDDAERGTPLFVFPGQQEAS